MCFSAAHARIPTRPVGPRSRPSPLPSLSLLPVPESVAFLQRSGKAYLLSLSSSVSVGSFPLACARRSAASSALRRRRSATQSRYDCSCTAQRHANPLISMAKIDCIKVAVAYHIPSPSPSPPPLPPAPPVSLTCARCSSRCFWLKASLAATSASLPPLCHALAVTVSSSKMGRSR